MKKRPKLTSDLRLWPVRHAPPRSSLPAPCLPLSTPFKADQFVFRRQKELMGELMNLPLYRCFAADIVPEHKVSHRTDLFTRNQPLPGGCCPRLDQALNRLRTTLRSSLRFRFVLAEGASPTDRCIASLEGSTLSFLLPPRILTRPSAQHLVHHLAVAFFHAHHPLAYIGRSLLHRQFPLHLSERERIIEFLRLHSYLADCFSFLCTGDAALTAAESFYRALGHEAPALGIDLRQFALRHLESGDLTTARFLENMDWVTDYLPGTPLVLERFQQSALHHQLTGQPGGRPMAEFEAEVLGLDRKLHPAGGEFTALHQDTFQVGQVAAMYLVLEATGPVTPEREQLAARFMDTQPEELHQRMRELDWDLARPNAGAAMLARLNRPPVTRWLNIRAAEILVRAWLFAKSEGHTEYVGPLREALETIGTACNVTPKEVQQLCTTIAAADAGNQEAEP